MCFLHRPSSREDKKEGHTPGTQHNFSGCAVGKGLSGLVYKMGPRPDSLARHIPADFRAAWHDRLGSAACAVTTVGATEEFRAQGRRPGGQADPNFSLSAAAKEGLLSLQRELYKITLPDFSGDFKIKAVGRGQYEFHR